MGGGFDRNEFESAYAVPGASSIPWLRPVSAKPGNEHMLLRGGKAPPAEQVAALAKNGVEKYAEIIRAGKGTGEVLYY